MIKCVKYTTEIRQHIMRAVNQVQIIGNLGKDPVSKVSKTKQSYIYFSLAEDGGKKLDGAGNRIKKTRWHDCIAWGDKLVELLSATQKGDKLLVQGILDYDFKDDGDQRHKLPRIVVYDFVYM